MSVRFPGLKFCPSPPLLLGMHDIIGTLSEYANNGLKCKHRHRPDIKNYAHMPKLPIRRRTLMCSGCASDTITSAVWSFSKRTFA